MDVRCANIRREPLSASRQYAYNAAHQRAHHHRSDLTADTAGDVLDKAVGRRFTLAWGCARLACRRLVGLRLLPCRGPFAGALRQLFMSRLAIDRLVILAIDRR